jgi:SEC-C motif-containing protein
MNRSDNPSRRCYCGSGLTLGDCCLSFIEQRSMPQNAEQLMRSRFSAFCLARGDYLYHTHHPDHRANLSEQELTRSAQTTPWVKLEIFSHGQLSHDTSQVAFRAWYLSGGRLIPHCELSFFRCVDGRWFYTYGELEQTESRGIRVGRNDPCPCDSGLKFKKCCLTI